MKLQDKLEKEIAKIIEEDINKVVDKYRLWGLGNNSAKNLVRNSMSYSTEYAISSSDGWSGEFVRLFEIRKQRQLNILNPSEAKRLRKMVKSPDREIVSLADVAINEGRKKRLRKERYQRSKQQKNGK